MGQEASVPQRIGEELSSSTSASTKAVNAIRGANDAAAAAVAAANNAAASVFVGQSSASSSSSSSQPQSQQQYANNSNGTMSQPSTATTGSGTSSSSSSLMSRSGFSSMIQSAKRLSVRSSNTSAASGGDSSHSTDATSNHHVNTGIAMNGGAAPHHQQHQQGPQHQMIYHTEGGVHHGELSPKSLAIKMQQQRQMGIIGKKKNGLKTPQLQHHSNVTSSSSHHQQQQQLMQPQYYQQQQQQQQQQQHSNNSSAQSTPYHTPQTTPHGSLNNMYMYNGGDGTDAQTVHTTNVTNNTTAATTTKTTSATTTQTKLVQGMGNLSLKQTNNHGVKMASTTILKGKKGTNNTNNNAPSSPRAMELNRMKDNDEDDWAKAWAEDSSDDDDDDEEEESEDDEERDGVEDSNETVVDDTSGKLPPSMPVLAGQNNAMGPQQYQQPQHQQQQQQQQQQQPQFQQSHPHQPTQHHPQQLLHQPPQQYVQQQYIPQQSRPPPYVTPGQPQPKGVLPTDRVTHQPNTLFTSPPQPHPQHHHHQQQQQLHPQFQHHSHYQQQYPHQQHSHHQQAIIVEEDAKLLQEADQALLKDGGSWDPYCADESVEEKPCVDMFDPALRVLGRGSFGRVVLVQKQYGQGKGSLFAMKILRKSHLVRRRQIERTKTERKVLARLDHPFLMKLYYAFQTTEKLYLVLDYCPGGELFFHLSRYRRFQEPVARFYAAELMLAIGHLHKHGVIYRDLKPENVLLDAYGHVKLGDFGLAKDGIRHPTQGAKSTCGTPEYMAPEVLNQQGHGFCVDYWGLGMILFEMMTGLPPWYTTDRAKLFRRLRSAPLIFPNEISFSPNCKTCIAGLLERDPRLRIGVLGLRSAMRHEFFHRRINFEALRARQISAPIRPCEGWRQFQSRSNSIENESKGWHSANPSLDSAAMGNITAEALDVATANFDDSFRRMPIETEDFEKQQQAQGHPPISEKDLNAQTFRGFTFDGDSPPPSAPPTEERRQKPPPHDLRGELT